MRYSSDLAEHHAVRKNAGIFDLSHMGEIRISGPDSGAALDYALAGKLSAVAEGRAKYSLLLTDEGGVVDDLVTYHLPDGDYLVVANAANAETDLAEFTKRCARFDVTVTDESAQTALVAVQGPKAVTIVLAALQKANTTLDSDEVRDVKYYRCLTGELDGFPVLVARTGYTGEDGYELYVPAEAAEHLWQLLMDAGGEISHRAVSPAVTLCAWKPGCLSTDTNWAPTSIPLKPGLGESSISRRRATSSVAAPSRTAIPLPIVC
ncbi:aminomethyltransferase [Cutibacterium acnes JCM 18916]|nr:aminomethyltransferase [Cutibacterium acnes JCM 18916]